MVVVKYALYVLYHTRIVLATKTNKKFAHSHIWKHRNRESFSCLLSIKLPMYGTCCLYGAGRMDLDGGKSFFSGRLRGRALKSRLFWAKIALAALVPISGPKKVSISGPTPSNAPRSGLLPHPNPYVLPHLTTGTLIVIKSLYQRCWSRKS